MAGKLNDYAVFVLLKDLKVLLIRFIVPHLEVPVTGPSIDMTSDDEFTVAILAKLILEPLILVLTAVS